MATCESTTPARRSRRLKGIIATALLADDQPPTPLYIRAGRRYEEAPPQTVLHSARHLARARFPRGAVVYENTESLCEFLLLRLGTRDRETFGVILLDGRYRVMEYVELFQGTVGSTEVHPREVVKCAVLHGATGVIAVHNHPSGVAEASFADRAVTAKLKKALETVDVRLVDHLIVGERVTSMEERGLL